MAITARVSCVRSPAGGPAAALADIFPPRRQAPPGAFLHGRASLPPERQTCGPDASNRRAMGEPTTIVHCADVHLETAFTELRGGARRRAALADAFVRVV